MPRNQARKTGRAVKSTSVVEVLPMVKVCSSGCGPGWWGRLIVTNLLPKASQLPTTNPRSIRCPRSQVQVSSKSFDLRVLVRVQVQILVTNCFFLVKGGKETLQDKKASPTKKSSAGTKENVPAGMNYSDVCGWGDGVRPGCKEACHVGGLLYAGWLGIISPQLRCTNTQAVVCQSHPA